MVKEPNLSNYYGGHVVVRWIMMFTLQSVSVDEESAAENKAVLRGKKIFPVWPRGTNNFFFFFQEVIDP